MTATHGRGGPAQQIQNLGLTFHLLCDAPVVTSAKRERKRTAKHEMPRAAKSFALLWMERHSQAEGKWADVGPSKVEIRQLRNRHAYQTSIRLAQRAK